MGDVVDMGSPCLHEIGNSSCLLWDKEQQGRRRRHGVSVCLWVKYIKVYSNSDVRRIDSAKLYSGRLAKLKIGWAKIGPRLT